MIKRIIRLAVAAAVIAGAVFAVRWYFSGEAVVAQAPSAGARAADEGTLQNLKVQLSYTVIRAPITGRISAASVKVGNFVRSADVLSIATIIQISPIYVTFNVPQATLPDIRKALSAETATIDA